jgi:hypothetical protein
MQKAWRRSEQRAEIKLQVANCSCKGARGGVMGGVRGGERGKGWGKE